MVKEDSPGKYVKSLYYNIRLLQYYLSNISNTFPFLEHLNTAASNPAFHENLITLHKESKFSRLKSFSACTRDLYIDSYIKCALEFRSTLTTFTINAKLWTHKNSPYYLLGTYLKDFPCLTELCIENSDTAIEALTINEFDSITDECKYLKKFSFSTIYTGENSQSVNMQIVKPRPDIENLDARMTTLRNDDVLAYVQHKFPKLKELVLDNTYDIITKTSHTSDLGNLRKVLTYISQIPSYHVQYRVNLLENDMLNILQHFRDLPANCDTPKKIDVCHAFPDDGLLNTLIIKQTQTRLLRTRVSFDDISSGFYRGCILFEDLIKRHGESIQVITLRSFFRIGDHIHKVFPNYSLTKKKRLHIPSTQNLYTSKVYT